MIKLTKSDVEKIREMLENNIDAREIAKTFNVSPSTIYNIKNGYIWADL
jgi:IS30 family transposase